MSDFYVLKTIFFFSLPLILFKFFAQFLRTCHVHKSCLIAGPITEHQALYKAGSSSDMKIKELIVPMVFLMLVSISVRPIGETKGN